MKVLVLGATGPSGIVVVKEALQRGHEVTALVRNPDKLKEKHDKLKIAKANIFDPESLLEHFKGQDAVLSCLGSTPSWFSLWSVTFYTDSAKSIVEALTKAGVSRFIFMSSWYSKNTPAEPFIIKWILKPLVFGQLLKNMGEMEDYLEKECPLIEYTSVRPPQLTNEETSDKPVKFHEGLFIPSETRLTCCRRDVARFMLDAAENGTFKRKCVAIASS